jgi:hypothetical protein
MDLLWSSREIDLSGDKLSITLRDQLRNAVMAKSLALPSLVKQESSIIEITSDNDQENIMKVINEIDDEESDPNHKKVIPTQKIRMVLKPRPIQKATQLPKRCLKTHLLSTS